MSYYEDGEYIEPTPEYRQHEMRFFGVDPDSDQGLAWSDTCGGCAKWDGNSRIAPVLQKNEMGFWCCPICRASYGAGPDQIAA